MGGQHISPHIPNPCSGWQGIAGFSLVRFKSVNEALGNTKDAVGHCHNYVIDTQTR